MKSKNCADGPDEFDQSLALPEVQWIQTPNRCVALCERGGERISVRYGTIAQGPGTGIQVVEIDNGPLQITLLPTRGMSIWQVICDGVPFKWNSPIKGPIHPSLVPVFDSGGFGWLEGFDEFLVRCGLQSNGAPDLDPSSGLSYPLHGRIANLPAQEIWCETTDDGLTVAGKVREQRLFFANLNLEARVHVRFGSRKIGITDVVTNCGSANTTTQMLYHINVGKPVLNGGSQVHAPVVEMVPRDDRAAEDVSQWQNYQAPTPGFAEAVHFFRMAANEHRRTAVMLESSDSESGFGVEYDTQTLPCFTLWKNTALDQDGYVTGLEPGTNFPNTRTFEASQGRIVELRPSGQVTYQLTLAPLVGQAAVESYRDQVQKIAGQQIPVVHTEPQPGWCS